MLMPCGLRCAAAAALSMLLVGAAPVRAAVQTLDFEATPPRLMLDGESLEEGGFRLTVRGDFAAVDTAESCFIAVCPSGNATQFLQSFNEGRIELSGAGGQGFSLLGFDAGFIAPVPLEPSTPAGALHIDALTLDGRRLSERFAFAPAGEDGSVGFSRFGSASAPLQGLGPLRSVAFFACAGDDGDPCANPGLNLDQFALDNLVLQTASPVPEPAPAVLMALGLAGLGLRRGRGARARAQEAA